MRASALQLSLFGVDLAMMRRYLGTPSLVVLLALTGLACYVWQVHNLGASCGYAPGFGLPSFPVATAAAVLIAAPTLLVGASAVIEHRSARVVAGFMLLAAVLAAVAFGIALLAFASSRHCFE